MPKKRVVVNDWPVSLASSKVIGFFEVTPHSKDRGQVDDVEDHWEFFTIVKVNEHHLLFTVQCYSII